MFFFIRLAYGLMLDEILFSATNCYYYLSKVIVIQGLMT